jgi:hypothetical protein
MRATHLLPLLMMAALAACENGGPVAATADGAEAAQDFQPCLEATNCYSTTPAWGYKADTDHDHLIGGYVTNTGGGYSWVDHRHQAWARSWSYTTQFASISVNATAYKYPNCRTGDRTFFGQQTRSLNGQGTVEAYFKLETGEDKIGFQVVGTHTFVPAPGRGGGGTFSSQASHCDDSIF